MEATSHSWMDRQNLVPSAPSHVSYVNEAFCAEDEGRAVRELSGAHPNKTDSRDSKSKSISTRDAKPGASSFPSRVLKVPQITRVHFVKPPRRSKTSRQIFRRADVARHVARINESSEIRECLSFFCVLLLGAVGVGVFLQLIQSRTTSIVPAALSVVSSCFLLVFIFICITTIVRDGTSLHRE